MPQGASGLATAQCQTELINPSTFVIGGHTAVVVVLKKSNPAHLMDDLNTDRTFKLRRLFSGTIFRVTRLSELACSILLV